MKILAVSSSLVRITNLQFVAVETSCTNEGPTQPASCLTLWKEKMKLAFAWRAVWMIFENPP